MYFYYSFVFILGLAVGSFLNVVIHRLHTNEPIVKSRSHCPHCGHILEWYELIPVFSFLAQKGKCRKCSSKISWQYPLVELATGLLFIAIVIFLPTGGLPQGDSFPSSAEGFGWAQQFFIFKQFLTFELLNLSYWLIIASLLIVIFVYDLKHYIIPDKILYPAIGLVFVYRLSEILNFDNWDLIGHWSLVIGHWQELFNDLLTAVLAFSFFLAIFLVTRGRGLGFGDVKFTFFMGLFLGWPNILVGLFLSWILGGIIGVGLLVLGKKGLKSQIPFGPFLVTGTFVAMLWGEELLGWYLDFLDIT